MSRSRLRVLLAAVGLLVALVPRPTLAADDDIYLGSGVKVGEMTATTATVHVRLTAAAQQDDEGRIPGCAGLARIRYGAQSAGDDDRTTDWLAARAAEDFSAQFSLQQLQPGTRHYYTVDYRRTESSPIRHSPRFSFVTAPAADVRQEVKFQVTTGQDYRGEETYRYMAAQQPQFLVSTGDNVYYDGPPKARDVQGAYDAYQMMYGLPLMKKYFEHIGGYFEKDDHDYRFNDADRWQQWKAGDGGNRSTQKKKAAPEKWLTHDEGIMVFKQVFPMSDPTYRTFRWGKGVQIWLVEGRDYRSPNAMPDGPEKTLWGPEQLAWLQRTLLASDADWRILISPTPIIGPDRVTKNDNHADPKGFWHEGQAFLDWIKDQQLQNLILVCGDRHWQYESLDLRGGRRIYEYSCGPTCDEHTAKVPPITKSHRGVTQPYAAARGGFLTISYQPDGSLTCEFFDQRGTSVFRHVFPR